MPLSDLREGINPLKLMQSFKNFLLFYWTSSSQTAAMIVISIELLTKIVKFVAPGLGVLVLGLDSNDYIMKNTVIL